MIQPCETCTRPIADGATICAACAYRLDAALEEVCAYRGLAYDLDLAIARQARNGARGGGARPATVPLPYDARASHAGAHLCGVLVSWAKLVHEETGAELPDPPDGEVPLARIAAWLRPRVGWLRHHEAGAEAHDEIIDAVRDARRVVDRPAERLYAGPCDGCDAFLYARVGATYVECPTEGCHAIYLVEERRRWLLEGLDDYLANSQQLARLVTYLGLTIPDSTIRYYAQKGRILAHGRDAKGNPMYRLGEVVRRYTKIEQDAR